MTKTKDPQKALETIRCITEALIDHVEFGTHYETPITTVAAFLPVAATTSDLRVILGLIPTVKIDGHTVQGLRMIKAQPENSPLLRFISTSCRTGVGRKMLLNQFCRAYDSKESSNAVARQLRLLPGLTVKPGTSNRVYVFGLDLAIQPTRQGCSHRSFRAAH